MVTIKQKNEGVRKKAKPIHPPLLLRNFLLGSLHKGRCRIFNPRRPQKRTPWLKALTTMRDSRKQKLPPTLCGSEAGLTSQTTSPGCLSKRASLYKNHLSFLSNFGAMKDHSILNIWDIKWLTDLIGRIIIFRLLQGGQLCSQHHL